jgi:hypothetical protein
MPLTRTYSFAALDVGLDNPDYAPIAPIPSSVLCHSQMPAGYLPCDILPCESFQTTVGKPFVKPPTMPFDRMSFIRRSSPLAPSHDFPSTLSVLPPPKRTPLKPKLNLYRKTLIFYWRRQSLAHREFVKKCTAQGRVSKKRRTPKKCVTTGANLPVVEPMGFEKAAI